MLVGRIACSVVLAVRWIDGACRSGGCVDTHQAQLTTCKVLRQSGCRGLLPLCGVISVDIFLLSTPTTFVLPQPMLMSCGRQSMLPFSFPMLPYVFGIFACFLQTAVDCERAFLAELDGNCKTPIAGQVLQHLLKHEGRSALCWGKKRSLCAATVSKGRLGSSRGKCPH